MFHYLRKSLPWLTASLVLPLVGYAQLRLEENFNYDNGELFTVATAANFHDWRIRSGTPRADVNNQSVVVDHTSGQTFNGSYQVVWPTPASLNTVYASFTLTVEVAPNDLDGYNFIAITNPTGEWNRARLFMKAGRQANRFRLGISTASDNVDTASFFPADLLLNQVYTVIIAWDNVDLSATLYIDAPNDVNQFRVRVPGGTTRSDGFRRFTLFTNSGRDLGRYRLDNVRVGEDFASVWQAFADKPAPVIDGADGLLLAEDFRYPNGELNSVSRGQWRRSPSTSNPFAVVENGRLLFDSAHAGSYLGDYTFVWSSPDEADQLVAGFYLRVQQAPTETIGFNIASFADRLNPEFQRSRLFIKRGDGDNTFRLGLTASDSRVNEEETNVIFSDFDLAAGVDHLVFLTWDPATLTARMYLNTEFASEPLVQVEGETNRDLRRFAFRTDSSVGVGRYEVHTLRISEDWQTAVLAMRDGLDSGFYDDVVLGRHFRAEGGWVVWQGDNGSPRRGVLWMGNRSSNGTGWVFHTRVGWLHLSGGSMDAGLFAWSVDLGWIYTGGIAGQEWFYRYADDTYQRWVP